MFGSAAAGTRLLDWSDLHGWADDDHASALNVFRETCGHLSADDWPVTPALSEKDDDARIFFERFFRPVLIGDGGTPLFTGYFEPELAGSRQQSDRFRFPLYRMPGDVEANSPWLTRQEIETTGALENRGLEIAWLEDAVDRFFLQVQGSGRIRLEEGGVLRVGYAGKNGQPYRSVGAELVRRGVFREYQVCADSIRQWVNGDPERGAKLLWHNTSYVFFREVGQVPLDKGPLGAMNRSVTAGRTVAVDPEYVPLGAPVWIEKEGDAPLRRLMVAQDTGSAIKGAQRADIFYGTGDEAGKLAGRVKDGGRMVVLLPIRLALGLTHRT